MVSTSLTLDGVSSDRKGKFTSTIETHIQIKQNKQLKCGIMLVYIKQCIRKARTC